MKVLLDVSTVVALLWESHEFYPRVQAWFASQRSVLCPIVELGFLRVSVLAYGADMSKAREMLTNFKTKYKPEFLPCDISALDGIAAPAAGKTTDFYLANLAKEHGLRWATLDARIKHPAALLIA